MVEEAAFPRFSPAEMERRREAVRRLLADEDLTALVVYGEGRFQADLLWLSEWPGGREGYLFVAPDRPPVLFVEFYNHIPTARRLAACEDVRWAGLDDGRTLALAMRAEGVVRGRVGLAGPVRHRTWEVLQGVLPDVELVDVTRAYRRLRLVRSPEELLRFERAAHLADEAILGLRSGLRPGLTEMDLPLLVESPILAGRGQPGIHFIATMPMAGPFVPVPSQYPSERPLAADDVLTTEITASWWGYPGQAHRTLAFREPDARWRELHDLAVHVFERLLAAIRPGVTAESLVAVADEIHAQGYTVVDDVVHGADQLPPVLRTHPTAHSPYPADLVLEAGMVLVLQPNPVEPGTNRGLQFGETVVVTETGARSLHTLERRWLVAAGG